MNASHDMDVRSADFCTVVFKTFQCPRLSSINIDSREKKTFGCRSSRFCPDICVFEALQRQDIWHFLDKNSINFIENLYSHYPKVL